jgi:hypothetical protein
MASLICMNAPIARPAIAATCCDGSLRSSQSLSSTKPMPAFWPEPAKLKPATVKIEATESASSSRKWRSTVFSTSSVRSWVAPTGSWAWTNMMPWSSSGRNAVGRRTNM